MKIKYIINSYINYSDVTLPILIKSLNDSGISNKDIIIYIGGSEIKYTKIENDIIFNYVTHNSFDYTSLIELNNNPIICDYYFYLHDTCLVECNFKDNIINNLKIIDSNIETIYLTKKHIGICNIGLYKQSVLKLFSKELTSLINCDKLSAVKYEGFIFKNTISTPFINEDVDWEKYETTYNGVVRKIENYKHIGLKKYKANWGQSFTTWVNKL